MKELQQQLRASTIIGILVAILGGCAIGFVLGYKIRATTHKCERVRTGYTKVAYGKGVTNFGDTVKIFEYAEANNYNH